MLTSFGELNNDEMLLFNVKFTVKILALTVHIDYVTCFSV